MWNGDQMKTFRELLESSNVDKVMAELKRIFPKKNFSVRVATNTNMEINFDDNADAVKFVNQKEGLSFKSMSVSKKSPETVVIEF